MRKLDNIEELALETLTKRGSYCLDPEAKGSALEKVLNSLVRKKRATVEMTDGGVRYHAA